MAEVGARGGSGPGRGRPHRGDGGTAGGSVHRAGRRAGVTGAFRPATAARWRLRVGSYRVAYQLNDGELVILVMKVDDRRDAYRDP
ncbi:type II toxin-antitoxin system RelE family toxin [Streptomyces sp. NRRL F-4489]|uniref:type II toxin-antitoxin system RelE family toxin n=1 Tax=Streptomyces sp. NRRL F-4489 TaxID=1609095 RepID=UPI000AFE9BA8|nr:type II toxin-antitoxin system RelE/ParE family toxin [Streptomyces sp. NRRL F-4489]